MPVQLTAHKKKGMQSIFVMELVRKKDMSPHLFAFDHILHVVADFL